MGTCCCAQRSKFEFDFSATGELGSAAEEERHYTKLMNQLPTYENIMSTYEYIIGMTFFSGQLQGGDGNMHSPKKCIRQNIMIVGGSSVE